MFRFICIVIFLILFLILTIPILIVEWIIGKFAPNARDISSLRIVQWGFKVILKITGVKTTVIGEENIPDEAVLFVGNLRHSPDIQPMQTSHRICRKKRNGEISDTYNVDASPVLSLP